jgi:hypothetical protein
VSRSVGNRSKEQEEQEEREEEEEEEERILSKSFVFRKNLAISVNQKLSGRTLSFLLYTNVISRSLLQY